MTRILATAILTLWLVNNVALKQKAYGLLARTTAIHGFLLGFLLAICIL